MGAAKLWRSLLPLALSLHSSWWSGVAPLHVSSLYVSQEAHRLAVFTGAMPAFLLDVIVHLIGGAHPHTPVSDIPTTYAQRNLEEAELLRASRALGVRLRLLLLTLWTVRLLTYARGLEGLRGLLLTAPACVADERRPVRSVAGRVARRHSGEREKALTIKQHSKRGSAV